MNNKKILAYLIPIIVFLFTCNLFFACGSSSVEIDLTSTVNWVEDGDTFSLTSGEKIRLADIDAPQVDSSSYFRAKDFTFELLHGKTVYLDVDNLSRNDSYGRLICLAYISYNSTHYMNVNKALLENDYAIINDYSNNDFVPSLWTLYVAKNPDTEPSPTPIPTTNSPTTFPTVTPIPTTSFNPTETTPMTTPSPTIPEYSTWIIILLLPIITSLATIMTKKKNH